MKFKNILLVVFLCTIITSPAHAIIFINEILADPAAGISGDANNDGTTSSKQDEFIELFNDSNYSVNISGWFLTDATKTRHLFPTNSVISPYDYFIIFGGGNPEIPLSTWQTASTKSLGFNNSGDTIRLFNNTSQLIDQVTYGKEGGKNQSLTYYPTGDGDFILHSDIPQAQGRLFSPGTDVDGIQKIQTVTTPELSSLAYLLMGLTGFLSKRKIKV
ncbi:hypothetical protein MNBD_UNCLBAC01-416 [hydrothermal vent metagenome]|uniref:LTD domain-containing protein n=1 Tax=hydrothermal vent metagenome TaxID=652676 RepID=A0A3B1DP94_9ZZZZ